MSVVIGRHRAYRSSALPSLDWYVVANFVHRGSGTPAGQHPHVLQWPARLGRTRRRRGSCLRDTGTSCCSRSFTLYGYLNYQCSRSVHDPAVTVSARRLDSDAVSHSKSDGCFAGTDLGYMCVLIDSTRSSHVVSSGSPVITTHRLHIRYLRSWMTWHSSIGSPHTEPNCWSCEA
jgi:hypothetical protein